MKSYVATVDGVHTTKRDIKTERKNVNNEEGAFCIEKVVLRYVFCVRGMEISG